MQITQAKFVISNSDYRKCPAPTLPEYAFIGRSNVGKSSLINSLTGHHELAKTSSKPGKTQLINHFLIVSGQGNWYLADLPGYGYARASKSIRRSFPAMIKGYLAERKNLVCTLLLIDSRLELQNTDLEFMRWLAEKGLPFVLVFTKSDKLSSSQLLLHLHSYIESLKEYFEEAPQYFVTSSQKGKGMDELREFLAANLGYAITNHS